jgi:hypothetical protein
MTIRSHALAAAFVALTACSHAQPETAAQPATRPVPPPDAAKVLATVAWVAGPSDGGQLGLTARLSLAPTLAAPLEVTVTVPPGVTLVSGAAAFRTTPGQSGTLDVPYVFEVAPGATGEILLRADLPKEGPGLHARAAWAVGAASLRTAPAAPEASGPAIKVLGKDLGNAVPVGK